MGKYKRDKGLQIPMEQRQNLNAKILYLVENHETELYGITPEDIFNVYMGNGGLHGLDRKDFQNFHAYTEAKKEIEQGQFFTPAEICEFLVACVKPEPKDIIYDLTYGKGDFFNYLPTESNIYGKNEWIYRFKNGQMEKNRNFFLNQPFPAYKRGYELFSYSYLPKKITVFGLEKANQDIYNASFLDELLEKTVITKNFEEVVGRKIYKIYQGTCSFSEREKEVYRIAVKEFDKIRRKYFAAYGNARKDSMFRILQQLLLLLKICADPSLAYEYDSNEVPTKVKKAIRLLQMWKYEKVAIGVRRIEVADSYYRYLKQAFPERQIFYITGDKVPCKQRQRIVEKLRKTENGILLSTQQSLSESMNIDDVDKIILPELHYNHAAMEQYYFRFIRYTSRNFKQVVFLIYENSIEVNLLKMILAKEKLNLFMKNQLLENGELYERFGINPQIFSLLMTTSVDQEGKLQIQWGEQKIS